MEEPYILFERLPHRFETTTVPSSAWLRLLYWSSIVRFNSFFVQKKRQDVLPSGIKAHDRLSKPVPGTVNFSWINSKRWQIAVQLLVTLLALHQTALFRPNESLDTNIQTYRICRNNRANSPTAAQFTNSPTVLQRYRMRGPLVHLLHL